MDLVIFFLIGAGINGLTFELAFVFYSIVKESFTKGLIAVIFIASAILVLATSIYINNIYGYPSGLFVLFGYALNTGLFLLSKIFAEEAE